MQVFQREASFVAIIKPEVLYKNPFCRALICLKFINQVVTKNYSGTFLGKDACQADSGGPLTWLDPKTNSRKLVGVVSFGKG